MVSTLFYSLVGLVMFVVIIALWTWFCWAVGSALDSDMSAHKSGLRGNEIGAIFGVVSGIALCFYYLTLITG